MPAPPPIPWVPEPGVVAWTVYTLDDGVFPPELMRFKSTDGRPNQAPAKLVIGVFELCDEGSDVARLTETSYYVHLKVANRWKGADERDLVTMAEEGIELDAILEGYETYDDAYRDAISAMEVDSDYPSNQGRANIDREALRWENERVRLEVTSREQEIRRDERQKVLDELGRG